MPATTSVTDQRPYPLEREVKALFYRTRFDILVRNEVKAVRLIYASRSISGCSAYHFMLSLIAFLAFRSEKRI